MGAALAEKLPEAKTELTEIEQLVNNIGSTVTDGLVQGLTLAVSATDNLAESMQKLAADILGAIGKALILNAVTQGLNALGGGDGVGLFSILAGGFGNITPKAEGGPVMADRPYLVGEEGPELVVPARAGTVLDADMTSAMGRYKMGGSGGGLDSEPGSSSSLTYAPQFETVTMNGQEYVTVDQMNRAVEQGMEVAAKRGAAGGSAITMRRLQNNRSTRAKLGMS